MTELHDESSARKGSASREALLSAAKNLFSERGYEAVSTRDLAEAAGVNLGAIQYHFGSKAQLFVEALRDIMRSGSCSNSWKTISQDNLSFEEATTSLCDVIVGFLGNMLRPTGPQACRIMFREVLNEATRDREMLDALVSSVVEEFTRPFDQMLLKILYAVAPETSKDELELCANSIIGQCTFYVTHRPFVEYLRNVDLSTSPSFEKVAEHISRFSLRSLGCKDSAIDAACKTVFKSSNGVTE